MFSRKFRRSPETHSACDTWGMLTCLNVDAGNSRGTRESRLKRLLDCWSNGARVRMMACIIVVGVTWACAPHLDLRLAIESVRIGTVPQDFSGAFVAVTSRITNYGVPSTCGSWRVALRTPIRDEISEGPLERPFFVGPGQMIRLAGFTETFNLMESQLLYDKTTQQPIAPGADISGVLLFKFIGLPLRQAARATRLTLSCRPISGRRISTSSSLPFSPTR